MTHPDWPAFLAAIIAEPDEDTPRLVAADFLDENGEADRAAFVRVQIALARLDASNLGQSPEAVELRKREATFLNPRHLERLFWALDACPELVRLSAGRASAPRTSMPVEGAERLTWRRGFVEEVRCPAAEWLRYGVAVRARNPVRAVELTNCELANRDAWYAGLPALRGLRRLYYYGGNDSTDWLRGWLPGTDVTWIPF